jgi:hypothetical protein
VQLAADGDAGGDDGGEKLTLRWLLSEHAWVRPLCSCLHPCLPWRARYVSDPAAAAAVGTDAGDEPDRGGRADA